MLQIAYRAVIQQSQALSPLREGFFSKWLLKHFGVSDYAEAEKVFLSKSSEQQVNEIGILEAEVRWCATTSAYEIERLDETKRIDF